MAPGDSGMLPQYFSMCGAKKQGRDLREGRDHLRGHPGQSPLLGYLSLQKPLALLFGPQGLQERGHNKAGHHLVEPGRTALGQQAAPQAVKEGEWKQVLALARLPEWWVGPREDEGPSSEAEGLSFVLLGSEPPVQGEEQEEGHRVPELIDRTESLNRSIRKSEGAWGVTLLLPSSNSVKKSQPALPISKIDERLEQYTQAIETAGRTPKLTRQPSIELPSMAVASTKSRWETGEVQAQSTAKTPSCKDIVAGDMSKKSLWEQKGGSKTSSTIKQSTPSGKRYKFVATGHGKYEKVLVDEGSVP
ncbi:lymphocyte-specific protein 1 [Panthera uncia]|uniref:lymphocyte-specific protein 1 n=1 Tax=Panthera uncia TaxID=29064 RepID=UPI0020FFBC38|nr:lymphocyte-specific protein 1 [Panthera uncia]